MRFQHRKEVGHAASNSDGSPGASSEGKPPPDLRPGVGTPAQPAAGASLTAEEAAAPGSGATAGGEGAGRPERGSSRAIPCWRPAGPRWRPWVGLAALVLGGAIGLPPLPPTPSASAEEDRREPHRHPNGKVVACRECPEPDDAWYRWEMGPFFRPGGAYPDTYETDGGECMAKPLGVKVSIEGYVWEPAGEGLVQDCPSGRYGYELNVRVGTDARFDWQVDEAQTRGLETGRALGVEAAADAASPGGCGRGVTLSLTQRLEAAHCHRMRWAAAVLLARLRAKADYAVEKRWRWWIKNTNWGYTVLYSGDTWRPCDAAHVELTRLAPMSIHLATRDGACPDAECAEVTVAESDGWMPKPPEEAPPFTPLRPTTSTACAATSSPHWATTACNSSARCSP